MPFSCVAAHEPCPPVQAARQEQRGGKISFDKLFVSFAIDLSRLSVFLFLDMMTFLEKIFKWKKRKEQRYTLGDHELVIYHPDAPEDKEVENISTGGISIVYVDTGKSLSDVFELDIKIADVFHLGRVRVKTISDTELVELTSESRTIRRLNGRFLNLNLIQEWELGKFLRKHGTKI